MTMKKSAHERLVAHGIRPSVQRVAVMEYLLTHWTHPTAEDIYVSLHESMPMLSRMTVYNTLHTLADAKAILALGIDYRMTHFDGDVSIHGHFLCRKCGAITDVPLKSDQFVKDNSPEEMSVNDVQLFYSGTCNKCKES